MLFWPCRLFSPWCLSVTLRVAVVAGLLISGPAHAQTVSFEPTWLQASPVSSPSGRTSTAAAYDAAIGKMVLFGGVNASTGSFLGDTWTYDGTTWVNVNPAVSPPARAYAAMAYDAATGKVVLFGGQSGTTASPTNDGDTWIFDGTTWAQQSSAGGPAAAVGASATYDAALGEVVMFGGSGTSGLMATTWMYNGTTWTQQSPASSPSARENGAMSYDAATSQVVLFGGYSGSNDLGDTWTYNGVTWTQAVPASSPSARNSANSVYDTATGSVVLFGGFSNATGKSLADTWTFDGTNWTLQSLVAGPSGRSATAMVYDVATAQLLLFGGIAVSSGNVNFDADTWTLQLSALNMGTANVCSAGSPTPCSTTATLTFVFGTGGKINAPAVLTQGAANVDFNNAGTGTCTTNGTNYNYSSGGSCTVVVTFAPKASGQRLGAVELLNSSGTLIATTLISGTGTGPLGVVSPGSLSTVAGSGTPCSSSTATCGDGASATASTADLYQPLGVAIDGLGNLYIADSQDNRVRKVTPTGTISTLAGTGTACSPQTAACGDGSAASAANLYLPEAVAVDGAGNVYIADAVDNRIREVTVATGIISTVAGNGSPCLSATSTCGDGGAATSANLRGPAGIAVDASGNLFIADSNDDRVREVTVANGVIATIAGSGTTCSSTTASCGDGGLATAAAADFNLPIGIAVDSAGNVYIGDAGANRVRKVSAATGLLSTVAGNGTACSSGTAACGDGSAAISANLYSPQGVALDAAGNLYIADEDDYRVRKVAAGTLTISTVAGSGNQCNTATAACGDSGSANVGNLNFPVSLALDGVGNLYVADSGDNRIRKVTATAAPLSFANSTAVGATDSTDGALSVTLSNNGNAALTFPIPSTGTDPSVSAGFTLGSSTTCPELTTSTTSAGTLASGASCIVSATFTPVSAGSISGSLVVTDNSNDVSATTQTVSLSGTATAGTATVGTVGFSPASSEYSGTSQAITISDTVIYGGAQPTGMVTFVLNSISYTATCTTAGSPETCTATVPASTIAALAVNNYTVTAALAADSNYNAATGTSATFSITATPPGYIWLVNATGSLVEMTTAGAGTNSGAIGTAGNTSTRGGAAIDGTSHVWSVSNANNKLDEITTAGASAKALPVTGLSAPVAVAIDGENDVWIANSGNGTVSLIGPATANLAAGANYGSSYETGVAMQAPSAIAVDFTGGVWVTSKTGNSVTHIIGGGFPTVTPIAAATAAGTQGVEP